MAEPDYNGPPRPGDSTTLQATVTFQFSVWNVNQERTPEALAQGFAGMYRLSLEELTEALRGASDYEVTITPIAKTEGTRNSSNE